MSGTGMLVALGGLLAAPSPSDGEEFNSVTVSPGLPGFIAAFILAAAMVLLGIDMTRRTRRIQAQARVEERMEAEAAERAERRSADLAEQGPGMSDDLGASGAGPADAHTAGDASAGGAQSEAAADGADDPDTDPSGDSPSPEQRR